jgi:DNA-binding CsgD family transcriptional regulator
VGRRPAGARRPASEGEILELIAGVYDAALQADLWQVWLRRLCRALHAPAGALFLRAGATGADPGYVDEGVKPGFRGRFLHGPRPDPSLVGSAEALAPGEFQIVSEAVPRKLFLASPFYREWMRPQGFRHLLAGMIDRTPGSLAGLGLLRKQGGPPFGDAELEVLRRLVPHLQRAIRVQDLRRLSAIEREAAELIGDALRIGALLVGATGEVLGANRRASALLAAPDGPRLKDGRVIARTPAETQAFHELVAAAARPRSATRPARGGALLLGRDGQLPPLVVLASPLQVSTGGPAWTELAIALVILRAPEEVPVPSEAALRGLYALTPAEARIACMLPDKTVDGIAEALGVSLATVRTHVQHLLAKTGTRRQSELVRLLVSGPWLGS